MNAFDKRDFVEVPELSDYEEWIISICNKVGLSSGDGATAYSDIAAWMQLTGTEMTLWEVESIRSASFTYLGALQEYREEKCDPPYLTEATIAHRRKLYIEQRRASVRARNEERKKKLAGREPENASA